MHQQVREFYFLNNNIMKYKTINTVALVFASAVGLSAKDAINNGDFAHPSLSQANISEGGGAASSFFGRFGIGAQVGTNGIGGHLTFDITEWMYLKGEVSGFSGGPTFDFDTDDVAYDGEIDLFAAGVTLNILPFKAYEVPVLRCFRITGGAYQVDHQVNVSSTEANDPTLRGQLIGAGISPDGAVRGEVEFSKFAPYVGIGWDWRFGSEDRFVFSLDAGVLFVGSGNASLTQSNDLAASGIVSAVDTANEEQDLQDELDQFEIYPVVQLALSYRF